MTVVDAPTLWWMSAVVGAWGGLKVVVVGARGGMLFVVVGERE